MNPTHIANPVPVSAMRILEVTDVTDRTEGHGQSSPNLLLRLEDGQNYEANMSLTARYVPVAGDYLITQEDGYQYLNPKAVFERKYSPMGAARAPAVISTFGDAIEALKAGHKVAREGWNGKGMWLALVKKDVADKVAFEFAALDAAPWIGMKTADEKFVPWLASQTDMLAEDWVIVP